MSSSDAIRNAAAAAVAAKEAEPKLTLEQQNANLQAQLAAALAKVAELAPKLPEPVGRKRYFSRAPFCNFHVMSSPGNCKQYQFLAGSFETDDPVVQKFLDEAAAIPDSAISTQNIFGHVKEEEVRMQQDLASVATRSHNRMVAAGLATG
jgi:hypothetical protein